MRPQFLQGFISFPPVHFHPISRHYKPRPIFAPPAVHQGRLELLIGQDVQRDFDLVTGRRQVGEKFNSSGWIPYFRHSFTSSLS